MRDNGFIIILQVMASKNITNYTFMKVFLKMVLNMVKGKLLGLMMMLSMKESLKTIK